MHHPHLIRQKNHQPLFSTKKKMLYLEQNLHPSTPQPPKIRINLNVLEKQKDDSLDETENRESPQLLLPRSRSSQLFTEHDGICGKIP